MGTDELPKMKKMTKISPERPSRSSASSSSTSSRKSTNFTESQKIGANLKKAEKFMKDSISSLSLGLQINFLIKKL